MVGRGSKGSWLEDGGGKTKKISCLMSHSSISLSSAVLKKPHSEEKGNSEIITQFTCISFEGRKVEIQTQLEIMRETLPVSILIKITDMELKTETHTRD